MLLTLRQKVRQKIVRIKQRLTVLASTPLFASTTVDTSSWQDAIQKLIEVLKPIYNALYQFFSGLWNFLISGTPQDVFVKAVVISLLSLGVAVFAGKISEVVKYFIYGAAISVILLCVAALLKTFNIVKL